MKKWIFSAIIVIVAILAGFYFDIFEIRNNKKVQEQEKQEIVISEKSFNDFVNEDFLYSKTMKDGALEEVETVLNGTVDTLTSENVEVVYMKSVIQKNGFVDFIERNFTEKTIDTIQTEGLWVGSFAFEQGEFPITINKAIELLHESNKVLPSSNKMTLRRPVGPTQYKSQLYIFGQQNTGFIYVDAVTGEVGNIQ